VNFSGLWKELEGFSHCLAAIGEAWKQNSVLLSAHLPYADLWASVKENLDNSNATLERLREKLQNANLSGEGDQGLLRRLAKPVKLNLYRSEITSYQRRINSHHIAMQGGLEMINL
jgi:hypothetical protein